MKNSLLILLCLICLNKYGQEIPKADFDGRTWQAPYNLIEPKDWGIERFSIPINFAPQIKYTGVEDIRFTPGWAKKASEEYWSYAFLWYLNGEIKIDVKTLENNLQIYYTGLITSNGSKIPAEKLIPVVTSFKELKKDKGDLKTYAGTIKMLDYMAQKPITLNCKVHLKSCAGENKTFIFYKLSPQLLSHNIWLSLDKLWADFKCKKQ
jgi:hypothetical protein